MANILTKRREPYEFMLWTGIVGTCIIFLFLAGAYLARKGTVGWVDFSLPRAFGVSTFFMLASSYTLHVANKCFIKDEYFAYRYMLGTTLFLGLIFAGSQYWGWYQLEKQGLPFMNGKVSGSFVYVLSGAHLAHLLGGLMALLWVFITSIRKTNYVDSFIYAVNAPNIRRLRLVTIYWQFLDLIWVLLYCFLSYHH